MVCFNNWKEARESIGDDKIEAIINYLSLEKMWELAGKSYWTADVMLNQVDDFISNFHNIMFPIYENLFIVEYNMDYNKLICDFMRCPDVTIGECESLYEHFNFIKELKEVE